jgi:transcriptional regulator with XRE-family HTH domain
MLVAPSRNRSFMHSSRLLGNSQFSGYDGYMEEQIGARVRARMKAEAPGLTQAEIAQQLSIPADAFSRSLNGKRAFTAVELVQLARLLNTSAHWFVRGEEDPYAVRYAGRHTFNHDTKTHEPIDWDEEHRPLADIALAYLQAYGDANIPGASDLSLSAQDARSALEHAGGADFVRRLANLVESEFGIDVVKVPGIDRGFALEVLGRRVIVVGETGSWFYENWSIAHELAHVFRCELSERGDSACDDPAAEARANRFAAEFLLPKHVLENFPWATASESDVAELLWSTGVSTKALSTRLGALKISVPPAVDAWLALKTQALIGRALPAPSGSSAFIAERMQAASARRFPAHLVATHRARVAEGTLLVDTLAWMLDVDRDGLADELAPPVEPVDIDWLAQQLGLSDRLGD